MSILIADVGAVRTITLDRPEALNALTAPMLAELAAALDAASADTAVRVVVLTGAGRAFCAGLDLKALAATPLEAGDVSDTLNGPARRCTELLSSMPKVTIAKVNGFCFTGALELALACDLMAVAAEAKLGDTHAKFGLRPTWGMSARLIRAVGPMRARELSYTARTFTGADAYAYGMASHCVPLAELGATVDQLTASIVGNNASSIAAYKDLYRNQQALGLGEGLDFEYRTNYPMSGANDLVSGFGKS